MSNETKAVDVLAVIDGLQFGFNHRRCPRCAGWNMSENGETDNAHTVACDVPKARAAIAELILKADSAATVLSNLIAARQVDIGYVCYVTDLKAALANVQGPQA